jgi:hypothetical protein
MLKENALIITARHHQAVKTFGHAVSVDVILCISPALELDPMKIISV